MSSKITKPKRDSRLRRATRPQKPVTIQQVRQLIGNQQTPKFFDNHSYAASASTAANNLALSAIPQGNTDSNRSGDSVIIKELDFRFEAYLQGLGGTNDFTNIVRVTIYVWHQMSNGSSPLPANIYEDQSVAQSSVMSAFKWDLRNSYTIIADKVFSLSGNGPADVNWHFHHKWKALDADWTSGSSTIQRNGIFALVSSDSLLATHPLYNFYSRVIYLDS